MRTSQTLLSGATVAALALLAATSARATNTVPPPPPPIQCTTTGVSPATFKVINGPSFVSCAGVTGGQCTEIEYEVLSPQTVVYTLQGRGVKAVAAVSGASITIANPCVGIDSFGKGSCHEQVIKISKPTSPKISSFKITLAGLRVPTRTTVALNSNPPSKVCEILGIGLEGGPNTFQATQNTEVINFKGCKVAFTHDPVTMAIMSAQFTADSPPNCTGPFMSGTTILPQPVADLEFKESGPSGRSYGKGRFADGFSFSSGQGSCTTYVIGGVVYTWGTEPCPCEDPDAPECQ